MVTLLGFVGAWIQDLAVQFHCPDLQKLFIWRIVGSASQLEHH